MPRKFLSVLLVAAISFVNADNPEKLVGAFNALPGQFPYTVSLRINNNHVCGGAIIDKYYVLTAAHCVKALTDYQDQVSVVTGTIYLDQGGVSHEVEKMFANPLYASDTNADFDVGVIKLVDPIEYNALQQPVALPLASPRTDQYAVASAWGETSENGALSNAMQYLYLKIIDFNVCRQYKALAIEGNVICTFDGAGTGLCFGDSGSPLVANGQIIGVVSRGIPCAVGVPDIFTSIYENTAFIREAMTL